MLNKKLSILTAALLLSYQLHAQDDLLKMAMEGSASKHENVVATYKTTKLINAQTNETVHKRTLDFRVGHRFGNMGKYTDGKSAIHTLYGLDASTDIRIAFEYGINDNITVGFSRTKIKENLEGLVKYRIIQQTTDNHIPAGITFFGNCVITPQKDAAKLYDKTSRRMTYIAQLIVSRKFNSRLSASLLPTYNHRNYVFDRNENNDIFALGGALRFRVTKSSCIVADYFYSFDEYRINRSSTYYNPLGIGFEMETGGHVFTVMFTNAAGLLENEFIPYTTDSWKEGGIKFSFNISRNFRL
jgi:hypothetical protein